MKKVIQIIDDGADVILALAGQHDFNSFHFIDVSEYMVGISGEEFVAQVDGIDWLIFPSPLLFTTYPLLPTCLPYYETNFFPYHTQGITAIYRLTYLALNYLQHPNCNADPASRLPSLAVL